MSKKILVISGIMLIAVCIAAVCLAGGTYTLSCRQPVPLSADPDDYEVITDTEDVVRIAGKSIDGETLRIVIEGIDGRHTVCCRQSLRSYYGADNTGRDN